MPAQQRCLMMVLTKPDSVTFGVELKGTLFFRAKKCLSAISAFGDLELRSASLYYGSVSAAPRALDIPTSTYRTLLRPNAMEAFSIPTVENSTTNNKRERSLRSKRYLRKLKAFQRMDQIEWDLISSGVWSSPADPQSWKQMIKKVF